jgi:hypothetical protein
MPQMLMLDAAFEDIALPARVEARSRMQRRLVPGLSLPLP